MLQSPIMIIKIELVLLTLLLSLNSFCQDKQSHLEELLKRRDVKGKQLSLTGKHADIFDGRILNTDSLTKSSFVFLGFYGCVPCKMQLPSFIDLSKKRSDINFIYISFDENETIKHEMKEIGKLSLLIICTYYI